MPKVKIKERFCALKILEGTPTQLAFIRSNLSEYYYIEIDNLFVISCLKSFKSTLNSLLFNENIKFILIYVNLKPGADVLVNGINDHDKESLDKIILNS